MTLQLMVKHYQQLANKDINLSIHTIVTVKVPKVMKIEVSFDSQSLQTSIC